MFQGVMTLYAVLSLHLSIELWFICQYCLFHSVSAFRARGDFTVDTSLGYHFRLALAQSTSLI